MKPCRVAGGAIIRGKMVAEKASAPAGSKAAMQPYFFCVFLKLRRVYMCKE